MAITRPTIVYRLTKGSELTYSEGDNNFLNTVNGLMSVDGNVDSLSASLSTESGLRIAGDSVLTAALAAESTARQDADSAIQTTLNDHEQRIHFLEVNGGGGTGGFPAPTEITLTTLDPDQTIYQLPLITKVSKLIIVGTDTSNNAHGVEVFLMNDGVNPQITDYAKLTSVGDLFVLGINLDAQNLNITATPVVENITIKINELISL